jgi:hypothetical protein
MIFAKRVAVWLQFFGVVVFFHLPRQASRWSGPPDPTQIYLFSRYDG